MQADSQRVACLIARGPPVRLACAATTDKRLGNDGVMALLAPVLRSMPQMTSLNLGCAYIQQLGVACRTEVRCGVARCVGWCLMLDHIFSGLALNGWHV